ncbi:hypothetical protein [Siminovitchia sp. 179-K 8D1 HS]|uniref:hypothetical protein n=1 Tax=Siminovitchia sp. 179-K 8D1 HS TaxID=3142385 RepID=UPI00399F9D81
MRYFEVHDPYYALIKAECKEDAMKKYIKYVCNEEDGCDLKEVSRDYALAAFSRVPSENRVLLPISQVVDEFLCQENEVLIIDGALL